MIPSPINKKPFSPSIQEAVSVRFSLNAKQSESLSSMEDSGYSLSGFIGKIFTSIRSFFAYIFCCTTAKKQTEEEAEDDAVNTSELIEALGGEKKFAGLPILQVPKDQETDSFFDLPQPMMKGTLVDGTSFVAIKLLNRKSQESVTLTLSENNGSWSLSSMNSDLVEALGLDPDQKLDRKLLAFLKQVTTGNHEKVLLGKKSEAVARALKANIYDENGKNVNPWGTVISDPVEDEHPFLEEVWKAFGGQEKYEKLPELTAHQNVSMLFKNQQLDGKQMLRGIDCTGRHFIVFPFKNHLQEDCIQTIHQQFCNNNRDWVCTPAASSNQSYFFASNSVDMNNSVNTVTLEIVAKLAFTKKLLI